MLRFSFYVWLVTVELKTLARTEVTLIIGLLINKFNNLIGIIIINIDMSTYVVELDSN